MSVQLYCTIKVSICASYYHLRRHLLVNSTLTEAEKWAEQFEKIYKRTTDGLEEKK